ncbi:helix-turn-helix domain-containing protein, partial [Streptomyces broussonetiae]
MPRWKELPEDLDPQIKEFTSQVRRLVDRSGLSVAALADRTGYSKTSWERYLGGRLLAPKGAVVALAEVTGTNPVHLTTMWELAERAWSRAEMRHDRTMEAIRISQARAALGDFGAAEATGGPSGTPSVRKGSGAVPVTGIAGPAGVSPTIPPRPTGADADAEDGAGSGAEGAGSGSADGDGRAAALGDDSGGSANSWGLAGYQGPSRASARPADEDRTEAGAGAGAGSGGGADRSGGAGDRPAPPPGTANPYDVPAPRPAAQGGGRQRLMMFLAGLVGVSVVIAAVFFLTPRGGGKHEGAATPPSPTATRHAS